MGMLSIPLLRLSLHELIVSTISSLEVGQIKNESQILPFKKCLKSIEDASILASSVGPISTKYLLNLLLIIILYPARHQLIYRHIQMYLVEQLDFHSYS